MREQRQQNPLGKLLGGGSIIAISVALGRATGASIDPASAVCSGFMLLAGLWLVASGTLDAIRKIALRSARKRAEKPTGVYGEAKLATPQDCADAGLTKPNGLFLGLLRGIPIFFNGKAHLITVAPARQGKGVTVVIPNGSVLNSVYLSRPMRFGILKRRSARRTLWRTGYGLQTIP